MCLRQLGPARVLSCPEGRHHENPELHRRDRGDRCGPRGPRLRPVARPDPGRRLLHRAPLRVDRRRGLRRELRLPDAGRRLGRLLRRSAAVLRGRRPRHRRHRQLLAADPRRRDRDLRRQRRHRHHRGPHRLRRHRLRLEVGRPGLHRLHPRAVVPGARGRGGQGRRPGPEPGQDLGRGRPEPARRPDPRLRPRHQARHPRGLRGEGDPAGLRGLRRPRGDPRASRAATRTRRPTPA